MSKLEKAMERAKQARGTVASPASTPIPSPVKGRRSGPIDPVYTQTRVYPFDEALLEKHGVLTPLEAMTSNGYNSILVASPEPEEGKTLTAVNLAISIARESNRTVLLIDTDMRQPSVHRYFGLPEGPGLYEHITKGTPLSELLMNPGLPRLTVLPAGIATDYPADLLGDPAMQEFVSDVKVEVQKKIISDRHWSRLEIDLYWERSSTVCLKGKVLLIAITAELRDFAPIGILEYWNYGIMGFGRWITSTRHGVLE
jgi:non-specific protein-tyrosine kinase